MKIEKNYYDVMVQDTKKIQYDIKQEQARLSDAALKMAEEQCAMEAQQIINLANEKLRHTWHIHNKEKVNAFHALYERALLFAEENFMNIQIETDAISGRIKLFTPFIHHGVLTSDYNKDTLLALIAGADSFMMQCENDMLRLDFDYNLTTTIEK